MLKSRSGFTLVELLIVIIVIAILAATSVMAYSNIQARATEAKTISIIKGVHGQIEAYYAIHGNYPSTQSVPLKSGSWDEGHLAYADANCPYNFSDYLGVKLTQKTTKWVPGIDADLPQSSGQSRRVNQSASYGCFLYQSDGILYVLSAWNMAPRGPQTDILYRRLGFREMGQQFLVYYCNHQNIGGGLWVGPYDINRDYYKHSYTISNITTCNETPPPGA